MTTSSPQTAYREIERKLLDMAFGKVALSSASAILLSTLIVAALWPIVEHARLLSWYAAMAFVQVQIYLFARRYMRSARMGELEQRKWRVGLVAGGVAAGLCWGSTVFYFPPAPFNPETVLGIFVLPSSPFDPVTVLLMFILAGVTAYASVAMAFVLTFAIAFLICTLLPLSIWLFSFSEHMYVVMGLITLCYLGVMMLLSRRMYAVVRNLLEVSEENKGLRTTQQESDWRMQRFFESAPGFFYTACMTPDGISTMPFASAGIQELFDVTPAEVADSMAALFTVVRAEDIEHIIRAREVSRRDMSPFRIEFRVNHRTRGERWIELNSMPQREPDGSTSWHGFMQDVTGRKRLEESLAAREREFRTLAENFPDVVIRYDLDGRRTYVNRALAELAGIEPDEMLGKFLEDTPLLDPEAYAAELRKVIATREAALLEVAARGANREISWFQARFVPELDAGNNVSGVLMVAADITERRRMEQDLQRRESEFRALAENAPDPIYRYDRNCRRIYINQAVERMTGKPLAELLGKSPIEAIPTPDVNAVEVQRAIQQVLDTGEAGELEIAFRAVDGRDMVVHNILVPEFAEDGTVQTVLCIGRDVTARKHMETVLQRNEVQFRTLAENLPVAVIRYDAEQRRRYLNPAAERMLHGSMEELLGKVPGDGGVPATPEMIGNYRRKMADVLVSGELCEFEFVLDALPAEQQETFETRFAPERDAEGNIVGVLAIWFDITGRKQAQQRMELLEHAIGVSSDAIYLVDDDLRFSYVNDTACGILGYTREELLLMGPQDIDPGISREIAKNVMETSPVGLPVSFETQHRTKDGRVFPVELHGIHFERGGRKFGLSVVRDITERKRMALALAERERDFRSLAENLPDNIARWDVAGCYLYINPTHEHTLGVAASEVIGKPIPDTHEHVKAAIAQVVASGQTVELVRQTALVDGKLETHEVTLVPEFDAAGHVVSVLGLGRNMTEFYRMQDEIAAREQAFRSLAESSPDFIIRYDREGRTRYLNTSLVRLLGLDSAEEVMGKRPSETWPDGRFDLIEQAAKQAIESGSMKLIEMVAPGENGGLVYSHIFVVPEFGINGDIVGTIAFGRDISAIREAERRLAHFIDNLPGLVYIFRLNGDGQASFPYMSQAIEEIYGLKAEDVKDDMAPLHALAHPDDRPVIEAAIAESARTRLPLRVELRICRPGHPERWLDVRSVPEQQPDGGILWYGLMLDITERKRSQQKLELLNFAVNQSSDGMFVQDTSLRFIAVNDAACRSLGYSSEELGNMSSSDIDPDFTREMLEHAFATAELGKPSRFETRHRAKDGRIFPVEITGSFFEINDVRHVISMVRDITERKAIEHALFDSERLLQEAQRIAHVGSWEVDMLNDKLVWSDEIFRIWEIDKSQFKADFAAFLETVHPEDRDRVNRVYHEAVANRSLYEVEHRLLFADGRVKHILERGEPQYDAHGKPVRFIGTSLDITERKQSELALRTSEEQAQSRSNLLRAIVESSPDVIVFALDTQYRYLSFNRKHKETMQAIWGKEIAVGMSMLDVIGDHPDREKAKLGFDRALSGESFGLEEAYGDELLSRQYWQNYWSPIRAETGGVVGLTCFVMNVTERRQAEEALRESGEKLRNLYDYSPVGIALTDMEGRYIEFNEAFRAICDYPHEELMALDNWTLTPREYEVQEMVQMESLEKTGHYGPYVKEYVRKDGSRVPVQLNGALIIGKDMKPYIWSIVEDITERQKTEAVLKERFERIVELNDYLEENARTLEEQTVELEASQEQLKEALEFTEGIINAIPDILFEVDRDGRYHNIWTHNPELLAAQRSLLLGNTIDQVLAPDAAEISMAAIREAEEQGISLGKIIRLDLSQGERWFELSVSRKPGGNLTDPRFVMMSRDVTERHAMEVAREAALAEAQRLVQLRSAFMAQMSHELRTPLNGILGYAQNLLRGDGLGEKQTTGLNIIRHSGEHLLSLINGLLDHAAIEAGKFELVPDDFELEAFLGGIIGIIRVRAEQKNLAFSCEAAGDLPAVVRGDAQRLRQVLINLLANAVKFTDSGTVTLRVSYPAPSRIRFEVQDSGVGIAADQLENIFLPFEQAGEIQRRAGGSGLGLAISRTLVRLMGGDIRVESRTGAGSIFSFEIEIGSVRSDRGGLDAVALSKRAETHVEQATSMLPAPPRQELDTLHALALRGSMRDVTRHADRLAEADARYQPFAAQLRRLAQSFQTKALLGLIEQYRDRDQEE